ncbi:MAG: putative metal-dependent hydrolase [Acidimicrobiia bacterium]|nr:putative metal-dependent hydrolase [Acidimicrobiia bacterium]
MPSSPDLRYPVGTFASKPTLTPAVQEECIRQIAQAPARLREAVEGLSEKQLETPYREGGWTVRQVVHHLPDSHMNAFIRLRLALTEDVPTIKPYDQDGWSALIDSRTAPIEVSLTLLESLHKRWVMLMESMKPEEFSKKFKHPESGLVDLNWLLQMYGWHGRHHVGHITELRKRMKW